MFEGADPLIHWHGVRSPADAGGVPGRSVPGIAAGKTFTDTIRQAHGTYWYHSNSRLSGADDLSPRVIEPRRQRSRRGLRVSNQRLLDR